MKKIIVGITGASGSIYAKLLIEKLKEYQEQVEEVAIIFTKNGKDVFSFETNSTIEVSGKFRIADNNNLFDATASGSASYDSMIIVPCSMGTLGRIASGIANDLLARAADVILKEKKQLILVTRETPLNLIHIKNMKTITKAGGLILPASPFFYHKPSTIDELINPFLERVLSYAGLETNSYKWGG